MGLLARACRAHGTGDGDTNAPLWEQSIAFCDAALFARSVAAGGGGRQEGRAARTREDKCRLSTRLPRAHRDRKCYIIACLPFTAHSNTHASSSLRM